MAKTTTRKKTADLIYTAELSTLEEYAEEYLRLERELAPMKKRQAEMKRLILENTLPDFITELENGINVRRATEAYRKFDVVTFQYEHADMYNRYCEDGIRNKFEVKYRKH